MRWGVLGRAGLQGWDPGALDWLTRSLPLPSLKEPGARLSALQQVCIRLPQENLSNLR